ncbi:hypothetical protein BJ944DRAFT_282404 [Cunninghamella echinulata]|nr:hypothetical protein BJ944DRAFT_282404 [Cunninghamella echinulata]
MKDNNHTPTLRCYNHLMDAYANTNNVNQVVNVFKRINQEGLTPDVYSYSSMIKALTMDTRLEDAFIVFKQMKKLNLIPTQPIFANLISGCLKSQQIDKAWETFDEMRISYHQPDEVTFTLMLHACAKKGEVERALNIFEDMVNQQLYPTDVTFNVLIHACAKRPDYYNEAFSLFDQMKNTYGFQPDLITYNTLIGVCAWKKDLSRARDLFRYIVNDDSMVPDIHSYTNMFWCYANYNPPSSSSSITTTTKENDIKESTSLTSTNIESILPLALPNRRSEIVNEAKHLFNYMIQQQQATVDDHNNSNITVEKNTSPIITTQLLTTYLNIHVMQRQYRECINIYDDLFSKYNVTPNAHTFMVMLRYCYQTKDSILAWRIWDEYQSFLESRTLHDSENMNDMSIMQQKQLLLKHEQQQYREGWTKQQQRKMIIMMANTLAKSNELNYSIQLLNSISKDKDFKPLKLKEVKMIYDRAILLEDEDSKEVITRLCSHNSKNFKPGSFKYTRINVK